MKNLFLLVLVATTLISCAKVRETNRVGDADAERFEKLTLTGLEPLKSNGIRSFDQLDLESSNGKVWLHKVTVTNVSSYGGPLFIGLQGDLKAGYFKFHKEGLEFLSAVNSKIAEDKKLDTLIYSWDVDHTQYRYSEINGRPTNSLEEDNFKEWYKKSHFEIDWAKGAKLVSGFDDFSQCWTVKSTYVLPESTEYGQDYMSFVKRISYEINSNNRRCWGLYSNRRGNTGTYTFQADLMYSFKLHKPERDPAKKYEPYVYNGEFDPLIQKYGYFKSIFEERTENGRLKVNFLMNRWNPKTKVHQLYFAPGFPEEYKWVYKTDVNKKDPYGKTVVGVIDQTNKVLEEAGVEMRFAISDAPKEVKFGDLRYSFIKFMQEANGSSPLGYGPSDANPFTGEIIAANSMVWTGSLKYYVELIQEWLKREDVETGSAQSFYAEMSKAMETENEEDYLSKWLETSKDLQHDTQAGYVFKKMIPDFTYGVTFWAPFTRGHGINEEGSVVLPVSETDVFDFKNLDQIRENFGRSLGRKQFEYFESIDLNGNAHVNELKNTRSGNRSTIYHIDQSLQEAQELLLDGKSPQEVIDTILYRVAIHEFGHNVSLRHNFYGSVDKNNFNEGENFTDPSTGQERHLPAVSSSVMDYLSLDGEMHTSFEWEAYDKAAIAYAYSSGKVDHSKDVYPDGHPHAGKTKDFLFCTDEHRAFNALCNTWDRGTTPTEILMDMIANYQRSYFTTNRRFGRAYWDTSGYDSRIFGTMWNIKKFMMLDQSAFTYGNKDLGESFKRLGISKSEEARYFDPIKRDIKRAIKLSVAFYNSVLQQSNVERQYFSEYDVVTGALTRKGIFADKLYATYFLLGDDAFMYNPNIPVSTASYLEYQDDPDIGNTIKKVSENLLTERVDSEPGFIYFARLMYADNALNYYNQNNASLANRFKMVCYSPERFNKYFALNPYKYIYEGAEVADNLVADTINVLTDLPEKANLEFTEFANELSDIGFAMVDGRVYVASKAENEIAYNVIKKYKEAYLFGEGESDDRIGTRKADVRDIRFLYRVMTGAEDYCQ